MSKKKPVLIFGCSHAPYHHVDALDFLEDTYKKWGCGSIVSAGDLVDFHAQSRFETECDAHNPKEEYRLAMKFSERLCKIWPKGDLVPGNHDRIPHRQMKSIGLDPSLLKGDRELYGLGKGWRVHDLYHTTFNKAVLVEHGIGSGGQYGAINTALKKRCSYVQAHTHAQAMVKYSQNYKDKIFGLNVGCLADEAAIAARYGRFYTSKGVLGCGVVVGPEEAYFVPMG